MSTGNGLTPAALTELSYFTLKSCQHHLFRPLPFPDVFIQTDYTASIQRSQSGRDCRPDTPIDDRTVDLFVRNGFIPGQHPDSGGNLYAQSVETGDRVKEKELSGGMAN
ncbi:hypothetical protein Bbelb_315480 [Branchiostoma belcheri]|nr:hypothetical protein Bbelb_315480 [Branchiostoma belcheri]